MPVDLVINCVITAIVAHSDQAPLNFIYHVASSSRNPFKITDLRDICYDYFIRVPCKSESGKPIIISKANLFTSITAFRNYMTIRYVLPLKVCYLMPYNQIKQTIYFILPHPWSVDTNPFAWFGIFSRS